MPFDKLRALNLSKGSGLILSGASNPDLKIGVWRRRTYQGIALSALPPRNDTTESGIFTAFGKYLT
jgi:hypothetical protein